MNLITNLIMKLIVNKIKKFWTFYCISVENQYLCVTGWDPISFLIFSALTLSLFMWEERIACLINVKLKIIKMTLKCLVYKRFSISNF